ncbi:hypothetical protein B0H13DRAFT_1889896 [Mycena leptocephala]|nr:hypothetical protein B0H13DRAFT_1889896 [Mycena leptocephala]
MQMVRSSNRCQIWRFSRNLAEAVAELLRIAAGDVEERHIKLRSGANWGEGSRCTAGVSFERRDSIGQETVARDGVKDATLQLGNRVVQCVVVRGLGRGVPVLDMVENDGFLLFEAGRWARSREGRERIMKGGVDVDVEEAERKEGSGERNAPKSRDSFNPDPSQELGTSHRHQQRTGHSRKRRRISMWRVNGGRVEGKARLVLSAQRRRGVVKMYRCPPSLREKIISQGLALSSGGQGSGQ